MAKSADIGSRKEPPPAPATGGAPRSKAVFISHAVKDKEIADAITDLLNQCDVSSNDIFCSSLEGMGIPPGQDFIHHIKTQIQNPKLVILMLSMNYFDSMFCICELGATWAMSQNVLPIVIPPASFADFRAVLTNLQGFKIDDPTRLTEAYDVLVEKLGIAKIPQARWEVKRNQFVMRVKKLIKKQPEPGKVDYAKFAEAEKRNNELFKEYERSEVEIKRLTEMNQKLAEAKDKDEVREILLEDSDLAEQFNRLQKAAKEALEELPSIVVEVLYRNWADSERTYTGKDTWDDIRTAAEEDYLSIFDDEVELNDEHPAVSKAHDALQELSHLIQKVDPSYQIDEAGKAFHKEFIEKHKIRPLMSNRQFWERFLGLA
jgi:hypothetical protein